MPLNQEFIGREYPPTSATVTLEALRNYARACNDANPRYFDSAPPGGIVAPPMFGVAATWTSVVGAVGDPGLGADLLRLLHAEQDMEFIAPLRPGDEITTVAKVASIEARPGGEAMTLELNARNRADAPVLRTLFGILIRAAPCVALVVVASEREFVWAAADPDPASRVEVVNEKFDRGLGLAAHRRVAAAQRQRKTDAQPLGHRKKGAR